MPALPTLRPNSTGHVTPDPTRDLVIRALGVLAVVGVALIHIAGAEDALQAADYIFWLYMALVAAGVSVCLLLLCWHSRRVWLLTAAWAALPLIGYLVSRS